jgi:hypothetical protein
MLPRLPRVAALAWLAVALAACGGGYEDPIAGQQPYTAMARFLPGAEVTVIQVTVSDRQALRGAELIGLGGAAIEADSIDASVAASQTQPVFRQSVDNGLLDGAQDMSLPPTGFGAFGPTGTQTASSGQIKSTALIRLPDPASYVKDWRFCQIRLRIGDPPQVVVLDIPAPQPPPSL